MELQPIALPVSQAAKLIGRSASLLWQEIRAGKLAAYRPERGYRTHFSIQQARPARMQTYILVDDLKQWVTASGPVNVDG